MRKICMVLVVVLMMSTAVAVAEQAPMTRVDTQIMEGEAVEVTVTRLAPGQGYALWCDAETFARDEGIEDLATLRMIPARADAIEGVSLTVAYAPEGQSMEEALTTATETFTGEGYALTPHEAPAIGFSAVRDGRIEVVTLVETPRGPLCLSQAYPSEAAEGFGARLAMLVDTLELLPEGE